MGTLVGGDELFGTPGGAGRYPYEGPENGRDWVPGSECLAASEFFGSPITTGTREMRDWGLRTYRRWLDGGRRRTPDGKPAHWVLVADEDDIITKRLLSDLRESRTAAVDDRSGRKRPPVASTPAPKPEPKPDGKAEAQASRWSRLLNLPKHRATRHSQTAAGVAERKARRLARQADLDRKAAE